MQSAAAAEADASKSNGSDSLNRQNEGKPTMGKLALASLLLSIFMTTIFLGGRLMQYGVEKVLSDWYFYVGFFVFAFVGLALAMIVASKFGGTGK